MNLIDALIAQSPSLALQRAAADEIARLSYENEKLRQELAQQLAAFEKVNTNAQLRRADVSDTPIEDSIKALHYERTRKKEPPPWWPAVEAILNEHGLQAIDFVADFKAAMKQAESCDMGQMCLNCQPRGANGECPDKAAPAAQPLTDEQIADFVGDEYHSMTDSELRWFRLGEAAHGIGAAPAAQSVQGDAVMKHQASTEEQRELFKTIDEQVRQNWVAPAVQSDDKDLLTIAFMDGHAKGKAAALAQQGQPVAYVKFRNGEVDYDCDDNCVISNTPGDAITDEVEWRAVFTAAPAAQPVIQAMFRYEGTGLIGTTEAPIKRVDNEDDGSLTVVIDHWPQQRSQPDARKIIEQMVRALEKARSFDEGGTGLARVAIQAGQKWLEENKWTR